MQKPLQWGERCGAEQVGKRKNGPRSLPIRSPSIEADKRPQKTARSHIRKPPLRHTAQGGKIHAMVFTHPTALPVRAYAPDVLLQFIISISDLQEFFRYFWNFIEKRRESARRGSFDRRRCLAEAYSDSPQTAAVSRGNAASRRRRNGYFPQGAHRACKTVDCRPRRMYNDKRLGVPPARSAEKYPLNLVKLALAKGSKNLFGILSSP